MQLDRIGQYFALAALPLPATVRSFFFLTAGMGLLSRLGDGSLILVLPWQAQASPPPVLLADGFGNVSPTASLAQTVAAVQSAVAAVCAGLLGASGLPESAAANAVPAITLPATGTSDDGDQDGDADDNNVPPEPRDLAALCVTTAAGAWQHLCFLAGGGGEDRLLCVLRWPLAAGPAPSPAAVTAAVLSLGSDHDVSGGGI